MKRIPNAAQLCRALLDEGVMLVVMQCFLRRVRLKALSLASMTSALVLANAAVCARHALATQAGGSARAETVPSGLATATARPVVDRDATVARWQEALELDLPAEILPDVALVEPGGQLAGDAEALALVARALAAAGADTRAQELLDQASVDEATRPRLELARARLALERDELERVLSLLLAPPDSNPSGPQTADPKSAGPARQLRCPELPEAWLLAGRALARRGNDAASESFLARFVEVAPHAVEAPSAWHMIAQSALRRGDTQRAVEAGERARQSGQWHAFYRTRRLQVRENPREPLPRLGIAQLWLAAGEPARAQAVLAELLVLAPSFCRGIALAGEAERALGDLRAARELYERALVCDPELAEARFDRALLALTEKQDESARADLEWLVVHAAGNEPRFLRAHLELARILARASQERASKDRYARYVALGGKEPL